MRPPPYRYLVKVEEDVPFGPVRYWRVREPHIHDGTRAMNGVRALKRYGHSRANFRPHFVPAAEYIAKVRDVVRGRVAARIKGSEKATVGTAIDAGGAAPRAGPLGWKIIRYFEDMVH